MYLDGRLAIIHPEYRKRFPEHRREHLREIARVLSRHPDSFWELLEENPVGVIIERVRGREVAYVVREVPLFDRAVALRLPRMPVRVLPPTTDVERLVVMDLYEALLRRSGSSPERIVGAIVKSNAAGVPLIRIPPKLPGAADPTFSWTLEEVSFLLEVDQKTFRNYTKRLDPATPSAAMSGRSSKGQPTPPSEVSATRAASRLETTVASDATPPADAVQLASGSRNLRRDNFSERAHGKSFRHGPRGDADTRTSDSSSPTRKLRKRPISGATASQLSSKQLLLFPN